MIKMLIALLLITVTPLYAAEKYQGLYNEAYVETKVKVSEEDGQVRYALDLPIPITSHQIIYGGRNYYHEVPHVDGATVVAYVTYRPEHEKVVSELKGYMGDPEKEPAVIMASDKLASQWSITKEDYYATFETSKDSPDTVKVVYDGADKAELAPPSVYLEKALKEVELITKEVK